MEINGLPLHALANHAAVVFGPLAALAGVLYAVPRWRDRVRWPLVALVGVALVSIGTAYFSGEQLEEANQYAGPLRELVETHEERAGRLRLVMLGFAAVSFLAAWQHTRRGPVRTLMAGLVALFAVAAGVFTILTGDAGAQIAWYGVNG